MEDVLVQGSGEDGRIQALQVHRHSSTVSHTGRRVWAESTGFHGNHVTTVELLIGAAVHGRINGTPGGQGRVSRFA